MKGYIFILLLMCLPSLTHAQDTVTYRTHINRKILIKGDCQFAPFEYINEKGKPDGFNIDLYKAVMKRLGLDYEIKLCYLPEARREIEENEVDIICMIHSPQRAKYVQFGIPHSIIKYSAVTTRDYVYHSMEDIRGKRIVVQDQDRAHDYLLESGLTNQIVTVSSIEEGLRLINDGKYDAMLSFGISAYYFIHKDGLNNLSIHDIDLEPQRYCFAVSKKNKSDLISLLNMAIYQMKLDGEYDNIYNKWFGIHEKTEFMHEALPYFIVAIIIVILLSLFIWLLRLQVKKAREELFQSESIFFQIYESVSDAIFIHDVNQGNVVNCNQSAIDIFKVENKNEIIGRKLDYYFKSLGLNPSSLIAQLKKDTLSFEWQMRRKNNEIFWANIDLKYVIIAQQERVLCVIRDIDKRKRFECELENIHKKLQVALDASDINAWTYNPKEDCFHSIHGKVLAEGLTFEECIRQMLPESATLFKTKCEELMNGKIEKTNGIYKFSDPRTQEVTCFESIITCMKAEDGTISQIVGSEKDVTSDYEIHKKLEEYKIKTAMSIQASEASQFDYDNITKTFYVIHGMADINNQDVIPAADLFDRVHPEDKESSIQCWQRMNDGENATMSFEARLIPLNGATYQWGIVNIVPYEYNKEGKVSHYTGFWRNTSKWHDVAEELTILREKAEESNRLKSAFLANLSHEIRTPLNAIVGFAELIVDTESLSQKDKNEYNSIITNNTNLLLQLINDILDLSKIESQPHTLLFQDSNIVLSKFLHEIVETSKLKAGTSDIAIDYSMNPKELLIASDETRLTQVLNNLISNAIKFTDSGNIRVTCQLQDENFIYFSVSDTGCGIPDDETENIFERFVKLDPFKQGTGLGLAICKNIIQKMGGSIGVISNMGKGSTFWFTVPFNKPAPIALAPKISLPKEEKKVKSIKILVAEDDASNYKLIQAILKDYNLIHAWNGKEAIQLFDKELPDIILMDIKMPQMDGYEATKEIRKLSSEVPIIAVTAYAYENDEKKILESGFSAFESKPLNPKDLKSKIFDLIHSSWGFVL